MLSESQFIDIYCRLSGLDGLNDVQWNALIRILRERSLVASFYARLENKKLLSIIPEYCRDTFLSSVNFSAAQAIQTRVQGQKLCKLLHEMNIPFVFLKGAAYILGDKTNSVGRLMTDIDICVEKDQIASTEKCLLAHGWVFKSLDEHDDKYYREWSHELPPLEHENDGVILDVHHTLIPPVKGRLLNISALISSSKDGQRPNYPIPSLGWLVLNSALHLILNEDTDNGLRDLTDIYLLLTSSDDLNKSSSSVKTLFIDEGFEQEWAIIALLLSDFFKLNLDTDLIYQNLSLYIKFRRFILRKAIVPKSSFLKSDKQVFWNSINYALGYCSKMPPQILFKQSIYKTYRNVTKLAFGEFFFRKPKQRRNGL
jgi:hypothetical protein